MYNKMEKIDFKTNNIEYASDNDSEDNFPAI